METLLVHEAYLPQFLSARYSSAIQYFDRKFYVLSRFIAARGVTFLIHILNFFLTQYILRFLSDNNGVTGLRGSHPRVIAA